MQYQTVFEKNPHMASVLEMIYKDILEFHQQALRVFGKPSKLNSQIDCALFLTPSRMAADISCCLERFRHKVQAPANGSATAQESGRKSSKRA
jgi:hypothetical protein